MHKTDSWLNSALLRYLHKVALTFSNLSYNIRMESTCLIFLAPLIYMFWYLVISWDFTLFHQHKNNMASTQNFYYSPQQLTWGEFIAFFSQQFSLFKTHAPLPRSHDHISYLLIHPGCCFSRLGHSSDPRSVLFSCCFLIPHLLLVLHQGHALTLHPSRCCCWHVFQPLPHCVVHVPRGFTHTSSPSSMVPVVSSSHLPGSTFGLVWFLCLMAYQPL